MGSEKLLWQPFSSRDLNIFHETSIFLCYWFVWGSRDFYLSLLLVRRGFLSVYVRVPRRKYPGAPCQTYNLLTMNIYVEITDDRSLLISQEVVARQQTKNVDNAWTRGQGKCPCWRKIKYFLGFSFNYQILQILPLNKSFGKLRGLEKEQCESHCY